jgi:Lysophospholipase L1 and related esterases
MEIKAQDTILFLGDSVTDCDRDYDDPTSLGNGFPHLVAKQLQARYPEYQLNFINKGISGNKIQDIVERLEQDCLALQPDMVIFLIGVNDTWHHVGEASFGTEVEVTRFVNAYREVLIAMQASGIQRIMVLAPFALPFPADRVSWGLDLNPKIEGIKDLASQFKATYLPLNELFMEAIKQESPQFYTGDDGVHPTLAGHQFIAEAIMKQIVD